ncbi:hypothetical protein XMM354_003348 [Aliiroseovarius sp. xm-m-354]|nr:hypothetical protein [Aliiroseovarius sp. xm-m-354]
MWTSELLILIVAATALALLLKRRPEPRRVRAIAPRPHCNDISKRRY